MRRVGLHVFFGELFSDVFEAFQEIILPLIRWCRRCYLNIRLGGKKVAKIMQMM